MSHYLINFLICVVAIVGGTAGFAVLVVRKRIPTWGRGPMTMIWTFVCFAALLELVFLHLPSPHTGGVALAEQLWFDKYWKPINAEGFRDISVEEARAHPDGPNVLFVGDSFTAGHGIRMEETVSSLFRARANAAGERINVFNLGKNGADTRAELALLDEARVTPDVTVLQYFINDVEVVARAHGVVREDSPLYDDVPTLVRPIVRRSYLVNYLYWLYPRSGWAEAYYRVLDRAYGDPKILRAHQADVTRLYEAATRDEKRAVFLVYPLFQDDERTARYLTPMYAFFEQHAYPFVRVDQLTSELPVSDRIVGANDGHPSPLANRIVMDELWLRLRAMGWLGPERIEPPRSDTGPSTDGGPKSAQ